MTDKILIDRGVVEQAIERLDSWARYSPGHVGTVQASEALRAALEASHHHPAPKELEAQVNTALGLAQQKPSPIDVDWLANVIRDVDGNNSLGAGALAEKIVEAMAQQIADKQANLARLQEAIQNGTVHADSSCEANWIADCQHLNCPACGGSGHVGDVAQHPSVPPGYKIKCVTDGDIRIYGPDGSTWLAAAGEDGFYGFMHKFLTDLLNAAPGATPQHPDDEAVDRFAAAMKAKMAKQRAKGYGGWNDPADCPSDRLQTMLVAHIVKGDPVDVGNFAMMLFNRGEPTAQAEAPAQPEWIDDAGRLKWAMWRIGELEGLLSKAAPAAQKEQP